MPGIHRPRHTRRPSLSDGGWLGVPNGMAVTPNNSTLIVAESYGKRLTAFEIGADGSLSNRRRWPDLGNGVPDGICIDAEGAVRYADVPDIESLLRRCYDAFNRRDLDGALSPMHPNVEWPNGWEGGWVNGRDAVGAYWQRQWAAIDPHVEPRGFSRDAEGRVTVAGSSDRARPDGQRPC
jgi:hypothetical protein